MPTHLVHCPEVPSIVAPYPLAVKEQGSFSCPLYAVRAQVSHQPPLL